jgi:hypothetical protein
MKFDHSAPFLRNYHKAPKRSNKLLTSSPCCFWGISDILPCAPRNTTKARISGKARVTGAWRFYFKIVGDTYRLEEIKAHPK